MVYNPYIVVPLATWAVAQVAKFAIAAMKGRIDFRLLYASGGMPSVHSAVVSSLAVTSLLVDGPQSNIFGVVLIVAVIVMYDSLGVRRAAGEQAVVINMLLDNLDRNRFKLDSTPKRLREILGHQFNEVVVGALTGVVLAAFFNYDRLGGFGDFFRAVPGRTELWVYLGVFGALVLGGVLTRWILSRRYPKSKVMKKFRLTVFTAAETVGWLGLLSAIFIYEKTSYLAWRLWPLLIIAVGVYWALWIALKAAKGLGAGLAIEANHVRKMKWLNFGKKSR